MEIGLQPNWHNEVNQKVADICSAGYQRTLVTSFTFSLETLALLFLKSY